MVVDSSTEMGKVLAGLSDKADFHLGDNFIKLDIRVKLVVHLLLSLFAADRLQLPRKTMLLEEFRCFQSGQVTVSDCVNMVPQLLIREGLILHKTSRRRRVSLQICPKAKSPESRFPEKLREKTDS